MEANVLREKEDIYYLTFEELREVVRTKRLDEHIIRKHPRIAAGAEFPISVAVGK